MFLMLLCLKIFLQCNLYFGIGGVCSFSHTELLPPGMRCTVFHLKSLVPLRGAHDFFFFSYLLCGCSERSCQWNRVGEHREPEWGGWKDAVLRTSVVRMYNTLCSKPFLKTWPLSNFECFSPRPLQSFRLWPYFTRHFFTPSLLFSSGFFFSAVLLFCDDT